MKMKSSTNFYIRFLNHQPKQPTNQLQQPTQPTVQLQPSKTFISSTYVHPTKTFPMFTVSAFIP